ncbi:MULTISPECIES: gp53-like domain-containing protein, partial [Rahnella]|uniref:gp53-like domain-containing protein n=1 Tax=Rahnella TaxID=34037 RepID=UPI003F6E0C6A
AAQASARTNLGLGNSAPLNTGTAAGTVAAGNDSRITGEAQKTSNLSDLANAATARSNLGLGTAATLNTGNGAGQIPTMANFTSGGSWVKFPDGTIIQFGVSISGPQQYPTAISLPIPFTQAGFKITTSFDSATASANDCPAFATTAIGLTGFYLMSSRVGSGTGAGANWIAIGR